MTRQRVLFLCNNNSCRSQMVEGFLRSLAPESFEAFSAGSEPTYVHPVAIKVMREVGIDISDQLSKAISVFEGWAFDFVIAVCEGDACPFFIGESSMRLSWSFEDPASVSGTEDEVLGVFRRVRDDIKDSIQRFIAQYG
ncbi:MAG: arsenate reductase ArsC [Actinobacteria bacterium]|nr:arsenate reductase ArsC [Actinomycetota bacterium]